MCRRVKGPCISDNECVFLWGGGGSAAAILFPMPFETKRRDGAFLGERVRVVVGGSGGISVFKLSIGRLGGGQVYAMDAGPREGIKLRVEGGSGVTSHEGEDHTDGAKERPNAMEFAFGNIDCELAPKSILRVVGVVLNWRSKVEDC